LGLSFFFSFSPSFFFSLSVSLFSLSLSFSCFSFLIGNLNGLFFFILEGLLKNIQEFPVNISKKYNKNFNIYHLLFNFNIFKTKALGT
jgi:hypothetical protein